MSAGVVRAAAPVHQHTLLLAFQSLLNVIVVALFIITFTAQPFRIPSESMEPTLLVGDFLLVDKQVGADAPAHLFAPANRLNRGDLIVFHYPVDPSMHLVKRIVGLPGDHLHLRDGHVVVNGQAINEPYAVYQPAPADEFRDDFPQRATADPGIDSRWWIEMRSLVSGGELTVPANSYFVLGDNRNDSEDSRYWGLVPKSAIVGKPFLVYFSLNNAPMTPGQPMASALSTAASNGRVDRAAGSGFARWDRALHVIY